MKNRSLIKYKPIAKYQQKEKIINNLEKVKKLIKFLN